MKQSILAKLVTKYPGLSKVFLGLIADKMATKVTEESGIDEAIAALDNAPISVTDLAAEFQKEGDRRVTAAQKEFDKKNPKKPAEKTEDTPSDTPDIDPETPAYMRKFMEAQAKKDQALLQEITSLKTEKAQTTIKSKLAAKFSEKGKEVPEVIWGKRQLPEKEEDLEAFETDVRTDWAALTKESTDKGLSALGQPKSASGGAGGDHKQATKEEVTALVKDIM